MLGVTSGRLKRELKKAIPVGTIIANSNNIIQEGFLECNGAELDRNLYFDLFQSIGTIYGAGDGVNTFNLPDLRGQFLRGFDNGKGFDNGRTLGSYQNSTVLHSGSNDGYAHTYSETDGNLGSQSYYYFASRTGTTIRQRYTLRPANLCFVFSIKY